MTEEQQGPILGVQNLKRCLPYKESKKLTEELQGPPLSVPLKRCLPCKESQEMTEEQQGPILGVRLREVSA